MLDQSFGDKRNVTVTFVVDIDFGFQSISFEGMQQFYSTYTEVSTIIKYRSDFGGRLQNFD